MTSIISSSFLGVQFYLFFFQKKLLSSKYLIDWCMFFYSVAVLYSLRSSSNIFSFNTIIIIISNPRRKLQVKYYARLRGERKPRFGWMEGADSPGRAHVKKRVYFWRELRMPYLGLSFTSFGIYLPVYCWLLRIVLVFSSAPTQLRQQALSSRFIIATVNLSITLVLLPF